MDREVSSIAYITALLILAGSYEPVASQIPEVAIVIAILGLVIAVLSPLVQLIETAARSLSAILDQLDITIPQLVNDLKTFGTMIGSDVSEM